ncbi:enoyl-CoA hydratase/isomerase family protein [Aneurinibacillus aneurinilyticus]|jgi:2-(1,2-epoxy-1,2-dihydrophenyl)acetyl-CoA isomerase|uniref:Enoyl-CoA hydratase n=2 Tax=Aneurinibacillus aneurinilyticus TaxID=1391 RepID=A0A848CPT4_ANEAE|nr:enoyl-CoA hydratase-related protein [Aneurinibacillus aneurinilyticus]ERI05616.1 enoyl-CoA hydratase/isomerase family protein [Aneurinibacillus aneurinilyticus ATCC 12856]MCI1696082.1 enoyl-CoA hydratase-related protein [Aneurinibacillus aneurinilyticus]MED0672833.1 enoyl-CoA hydratase-related protein [Aneurinibacillus aneurinilyticus]MED0706246.1 enoyl-CoA hydratase-related protein [Aneurinibacillus aneurinilyticus]MED0724200.1 enoyl-CoA hydratase-related protein [Aneurinibacillus aneurini
MGGYTTIAFDVKDNVATIKLDRQEAANAVNLELAKDLLHVALQCDESSEVRAVVITGTGSVFSVGGDLKSFAEQGSDLPIHLKEVTTYLHAAMSRFTRMDAPVIAAVNGVAAGAGMSMAIAADLVIAAESSRFTMAYTRVGLTPDGSASYFLPRIVGLKRALELTLTNRVLSAQEAYELGIATHIVPDTEVLTQAHMMAAKLAHGPRTAFGAAKRLLHSGWNQTLETQMENEAQTLAKMAQTREGIEGIKAFLEKRPPNFKR